MKSTLSLLAQNWKSGLTVALVSIPLSLSLAVASGASPQTGLITAVWAGLIAGIFASSNYNIIGPAGALTGVLALFAFEHGAHLLPFVAIVSGAFILLAYAFKLHKYMVLIPRSVMVGFSTGVAILISISQLKSVFGLHQLENAAEPIENLLLTVEHIGQAHWVTFAVFAGGVLLMWVFSKLVSKIPPAIFLAPIGIAFGYATSKGWIPVETLLLNERYPNLELSLFKISTEVELSQAVILTGASVAFIAILETLISAKIAENLTKVRYNSRRELLGLALANIGSGLFGGLPATGVFVRTGLNVKSGATHRTSQILQSLFVGLISVLIFTTFTYIPLAIIASILIFAAVRMLEIRDMKKYWKYSKKDFAVAVLVIMLMVAIDSVIGLLAGTVLALLFFVENFSKGHCDLTRNRNNMLIDKLYEGNFSKFTDPVEVVVYSFKGALTYVNGDTHKDRLHEKIDLFDTIILRMRDLAHIDHDGVEIFYEILDELKQKGKTVYITGLSAETKKALKKHDGAEHLKKVTVMANTTMALRALGFTV